MARITVTPANEDEVIFAGIPSNPQEGAVSAASESAGAVNAESIESKPATSVNAAGPVPGAAVMKSVAPSASEGIIGAGASAGVPATIAPSADLAADAHPVAAVAASAESGTAKNLNRSAASSKGKASDTYHETTLEDLEPIPMPLAQRIVIVAAVVCIIGALVYYFVAMR